MSICEYWSKLICKTIRGFYKYQFAKLFGFFDTKYEYKNRKNFKTFFIKKFKNFCDSLYNIFTYTENNTFLNNCTKNFAQFIQINQSKSPN